MKTYLVCKTRGEGGGRGNESLNQKNRPRVVYKCPEPPCSNPIAEPIHLPHPSITCSMDVLQGKVGYTLPCVESNLTPFLPGSNHNRCIQRNRTRNRHSLHLSRLQRPRRRPLASPFKSPRHPLLLPPSGPRLPFCALSHRQGSQRRIWWAY